MARHHEITRREEQSPFRTLERFADEMDRVFGNFGLGRSFSSLRPGWTTGSSAGEWTWAPDIEVFHRNNELVVRADLPGLSPDAVKVDVDEERLTIQGERKHEQAETREGVYRSERSYGSFYREIPLPPGAMADRAKATFRDGVLEVVMPAAPESTRRSRRLEIEQASSREAPKVHK